MTRIALSAVRRPDPDADLVRRFAESRCDAAFGELVRRHGPAVLGVCRRILHDPAAADDAFQAVFVVLSRRAGSVVPPGAVGAWLYGVAVRTANKANTMRTRRRRHERAAAETRPATGNPPPDPDLRAVLDAEIAKLPDAYRLPVILCDVTGRTRAAAAQSLGWPEGTVAARLTKGRAMLAARLLKRGVAPAVGGLATAVSVPPALAAAAMNLANTVPIPVELLAEAVMRSLRTAAGWKLSLAAVAAFTVVSVGLATYPGPADPPAKQPPPAAAAAPIPPPPPPTGGWVARPLVGDRTPILALAVTPDGKHFVTAAADGIVTSRDRATGKEGWKFTAPAREFLSLAAAPDGKTLAVGHNRGIAFHDPATGAETSQKPWTDDTGRALAYGPSGTQLGFAGGGKFTARWLQNPGEVAFGPLANVEKVPSPLPAAVSWAPDGKRVLFIPSTKDAAGKYHVVAWGAGSGSPMQLLVSGKDPVTAVAWSPDGSRVAAGDAAGKLVTWDGGKFTEEQTWTAPGAVTSLAFSPSGELAVGVNPKPATGEAHGRPRVVVYAFDQNVRGTVADLDADRRGVITAVAFAPDGFTLFAALGDDLKAADGRDAPGGVRIWDRPKPKEKPVWTEKPFPAVPPAATDSVAFAPDGKSFAVAGRGETTVFDAGTLAKRFAVAGGWPRFMPRGALFTHAATGPRVWDETGKMVTNYPAAKTESAWQRAAFSADGKSVVGFDMQIVEVRDVATGFIPVILKGQGRWREGFEDVIAARPLNVGPDWAPDGGRVLGYYRHGTGPDPDAGLGVWDAGTGDRLWGIAHNMASRATAAAFAPDGKTVVTAGYLVRRLDAATGKLVKAFQQMPSRSGEAERGAVATCIAASADGKFVAVGYRLLVGKGPNFRVGVWDADTGELLNTLLVDHARPVKAVAFSADSQVLAAAMGGAGKDAGDEPTAGVRVWERAPPPVAATWTEKAFPGAGPPAAPVRSVVFGPAGDSLAFDYRGGTSVYETATLKKRFAVEGVWPAFVADGGLATLAGDNPHLWDAGTGKLKTKFPAVKPKFPVPRFAFAPDGKRLAGFNGTDVEIRDTSSGQVSVDFRGRGSLAGMVMVGPAGRGLEWTRDGSRLLGYHWAALLKEGPRLAVWNATGERRMTLYEPDESGVVCAAFAPDGESVLVGGNTVRRFDPDTNAPYQTLTFDGQPPPDSAPKQPEAMATCVTASADGKFVAAGYQLRALEFKGPQFRIAIWDAVTGKLLDTLLVDPNRPVTAVAFSADSRYLAAAIGDPSEGPGGDPAAGVRVWETTPR